MAIDGDIEPMGPSQPYLGLSLIAPISNRHGWYWVGGYTHRKDCMHFECSETLVQSFGLWMRSSRAAGLPVLLMLAAVAPAPAGPAMRSDPATGCRFVVPDSMGTGATAWLGDCPDRLATRLGVLRVTQPGHKPQLFAGRMQAGQPVCGLIDLGDDATGDYGPAWRFEGAHPVDPADPAQLGTGFKEASAGAAAAATRFAHAGNAASARFSTAWSQALAKAPGQSE